jgi:3,4-dihydroxy 2-butanone 4-phosphate synthase/GTP cyclohydrolase II
VTTRVELVVETVLPTRHAVFRCLGYRADDGHEHLALVLGDPAETGGYPLVRMHSECLTGDVLGSHRCDCGAQLDEAMRRVAAERCGIVLYVRGHEGRGIGLLEKLRAYRLQDLGRDTVDANIELGHDADARDYGAAAAVLDDLGVSSVRLLTNNPRKRAALARHGIDVAEAVPLVIAPTGLNDRYLATKRDRLGHSIPAF